MARIIVIGGGIGGLSSASLLAKQGHDVTVLERDPAPPPASGGKAWDSWERRGVNQFRMIHFFLPRFRQIAEAELPEFVKELDADGIGRFNPIALAPPEVTGGFRESDDRFESMTGRRPMVEAAFARAVDATDGITMRRGAAVKALLTGAPLLDGVPHVIGVVTDDGEELTADLVVDATGRRSALPSLLGDIGARPPSRSAKTPASCTTAATTARRTARCRSRSVPCCSPTTPSRCSRSPPTTAPGAWASSRVPPTPNCARPRTPGCGRRSSAPTR